MDRSLRMFALIFLMLAPGLALAQDSANDKVAAADAAYQAKDWTKAEPLYEQLALAQPENARYEYRLGVSRQALGQHQQAIDAFQKARSLGVPATVVDYNLAVVYASMGQTDPAFEQLAAAVKAGYAQPDQLASDPDIQSLRQDSRFAGLLEQSRRNQKPCAYTAENRQFAGYFGKSYNVYNANLKRWEQFWVDNGGGMIHFYGGIKDGVMDFYTDDVPQLDGTSLKRHLQFFNLGPDKVRQFSQGSKDGGKTWSVEYDLTYNRTK